MHYRGPIGSYILFRRFDAMVADARQSDGGNRASQRAFFDELPRSFAAEDRKEVVVDVIGPHQRKGSRWGRKRERWRGRKFCSNICRKVATKRTRRWRKTIAKRGVCMVMRNSRHYLVVNHVKRGLKSGGAIIQPIINAFLLVAPFIPGEKNRAYTAAGGFYFGWL